jgi:Flp pilus assembly protein TadG
MTGFNANGRRGILQRIRSLWADRRGVGAIEFALVAPVLVVLYIGSLEVSVAMSVNKKLARATSTVADILTQGSSTTKDELTTMVGVAHSIMAPFDPAPVDIRISNIRIDEDGVARVAWSWKPNGNNGEIAYLVNSLTDVPDTMRTPNTYLLRTEIDYRHSMITSFPITGRTMTGIDMSKTYHLSSRIGTHVACGNC